MDNSTYKKIEIVGTSPNSFSEAVKNGVERASATVKNMGWFEVMESRGRIEDGGKVVYQVTLKVGFRIE